MIRMIRSDFALFPLLMLLAGPVEAGDQRPARGLAEAAPPVEGVRPDETFRRELELVYLFDGDEPEFLFLIGQSGFRSVESLQRHLETWPPGSQLTWAPGCVRLGGEPLLSSPEALQAFQSFLSKREIALVMVPSG